MNANSPDISRNIPLVFAVALSCVSSGCADGPFFHLKKLNPVIVNQWKQDAARGPVYADRIDEFDSLRSQIATYPPEERNKYISTVSQVATSDTSSEIRRRAILVLGQVVDEPAALESLAKASLDKNEKVRMAVAKTLAKSHREEGTKTLLAMAASDKSVPVKLLATESLGSHKSDDVKSFLVQQLNDKSPATQASATIALKEYTGVDFRGDVASWKRYMNGEAIAPPTASFAEKVLSTIR
jgi:hypothetical protein